ncbi:outer membrane assembly protein AsmA [Providencia huaxiensis]|uniref:outer membrane assembly protein AsmA n=1 Tax=Providencia huaxiensis TaxID=2027290 RepID=UPI0034DD22C0
MEKINISNSLVIWQTAKDEFNLRNINLSLKKSDKKQIAAKFSGNLNKNQQELIFDTRADIDLSNINQKISGKLTQFDYKLSGVDLPENGIEGQITSDFLYSKGKIENASLSNLLIKANESSLTGNISIQLTDIPKVAIELVSDKLDLDNLLGTAAADSNSTAETNNNRIGVKPVISGSNTQQYDLSGLQSFTADINLAINHLVYRGMTVTDVVFEAQNQAPRFSVAKLQGKAFGGDFSLPVTLNYRSTPAYVSAKPKFNHIDLTPLLKAFNMPQKISGIISLNATLSGIGYDDYAVKNQWQGPVSFELRSAKLQGLNIPQLIQQSVSRVTNKINAPVNTGNYTEVDLFKVAGILNKGNLNISSMQATSALVNINGQGNMNIPNETIDVNLGVNIANGWGGDSRLVKQLQEMTIPLRIYGSWYSLQYQLDVEKLLRNELRTQAKEAIGNFLKKEENKGLNDLLNAL